MIAAFAIVFSVYYSKYARLTDEKLAQGPFPHSSLLYSAPQVVGVGDPGTPLQFAARQGHAEVVKALVEAGADVNQINPGDKSTPLVVATINGHFDIGAYLLEHGADPNLASDNGVAPLYGTLNVQWAPKALYPQPRVWNCHSGS